MNETTPSNDGGVPGTTYGSNLTIESSHPPSSKDLEKGIVTPTRDPPSRDPLEGNANPMSPKAIIKDTLNVSGLSE